MMAVAEARAAWQRTANRCFVQEDAKRAPKLACCPSSAASTKQVDPDPATATDGQDHYVQGFFPLNDPPSCTRVPSETSWWLQLHPDYGYQRRFTNEQNNTLEAEMDIYRAGFASLNVKPYQVHSNNDDVSTLGTKNLNSEPSCGTESIISASFAKKDTKVKKQELTAEYAKNLHEPIKVKNGEESFEFIEMDLFDSGGFKKADDPCYDSGTLLIGGGKKDPWWRTADGDDLASFVAERSLDLIDNCDLPQPHNTHMKSGLNMHVGCLDGDESLSSSVDRKTQAVERSNPSIDTISEGTHGIACRSNWSVGRKIKSGTDRPISYNIIGKGRNEMKISEKDPCKAQLLEALMHSQTRAREAEMAANQAYAEKEHVVELFFRQASQLFAYKQWFQLLQLENLYIQIKNNKNHPMFALFPAYLPWMPLKTRKMRKNLQKAAKGKHAKEGREKCNIGNYALMFALGLSLVGAGLYLGWTVGWMFPVM